MQVRLHPGATRFLYFCLDPGERNASLELSGVLLYSDTKVTCRFRIEFIQGGFYDLFSRKYTLLHAVPHLRRLQMLFAIAYVARLDLLKYVSKFCKFSSDIDYNSKTEVFRAVI